jgi:hypothetical protein
MQAVDNTLAQNALQQPTCLTAWPSQDRDHKLSGTACVTWRSKIGAKLSLLSLLQAAALAASCIACITSDAYDT